MTNDEEKEVPSKLVATAPKEIYLNISDDPEPDSEFPSNHDDITWCESSVVSEEVKYIRADIHAARIAELEQREKAVPDGWKMVPIEPTDKMCAAAINATMKHRQQVNGIPQYKAMLAAAPQPSDAEIVKGGVKFIMGNGLDEGTYMVPAPHKE